MTPRHNCPPLSDVPGSTTVCGMCRASRRREPDGSVLTVCYDTSAADLRTALTATAQVLCGVPPPPPVTRPPVCAGCGLEPEPGPRLPPRCSWCAELARVQAELAGREDAAAIEAGKRRKVNRDAHARAQLAVAALLLFLLVIILMVRA